MTKRSALEDLERLQKALPGTKLVDAGPGYMMLTNPYEPKAGEQKPEAPGADWDDEAMEEFISFVRETATKTIEKDGHHIPLAFVLATYNPMENRAMRHVLPIYPSQFSDEDDKDGLSACIRQVAKRFRGTGVVFMSEAWTLRAKSEEEYAPWRGKLDAHPERIEILMMTVETSRQGSTMWSAEITRDAENNVKLKPWESIKATSKGRFTHLLPQTS